MKVAIGGDHAGLALKSVLAEVARGAGHDVLDLGAARYDADDDYPDFAAAVGRAVAEGRAERGILVCGSGVGASVAANKIRGVRAGLCHDTYSAHQGVEHDDVNVLCVGARVIGEALAREILLAFLGARFSGEPRHARRLKKTIDLERG
ncbi:MAG TPA: ribose 5-phosphate isomerase B [Candidatus Polarisedimenticolia bacterium]